MALYTGQRSTVRQIQFTIIIIKYCCLLKLMRRYILRSTLLINICYLWFTIWNTFIFDRYCSKYYVCRQLLLQLTCFYYYNCNIMQCVEN